MDLLEAAKNQVLADSDVVVEFFWSFNWLETRIIQNHGQGWGEGIFKSSDEMESLQICWSRFGRHLEDCLVEEVDCSEFAILCERPPQRRSQETGFWISSRPRPLSLRRAFSQVSTLRNNLFHGSKSEGCSVRNTELLQAGIAVIRCIYDKRDVVFRI